VVYLSRQTKIFKAFNRDFAQIDFDIDFKHLEEHTILYASQWIEPSLRSSVVLALWNSRKGIFAVFDEIETDNPAPETVLIALTKRMQSLSDGRIRDFKLFKWYGNSVMFGKHSIYGDVSDTYRRRGVMTRDNNRYDEMGSIQLVSRMLTRKQLFLHKRVSNLSRQMSSWSIAINGKKPDEEGYGMCRALCNIVSVLWESGTAQKIEPKYYEYTPEHTRHLESVERIASQGLLDDVLSGNRGGNSDYIDDGKNSWMMG
jgi:hypothetical protein